MPVSILFPPEVLWGYDRVTAAYSESPEKSWHRICDHVREMYPDAPEREILRLIGKKPEAE